MGTVPMCPQWRIRGAERRIENGSWPIGKLLIEQQVRQLCTSRLLTAGRLKGGRRSRRYLKIPRHRSTSYCHPMVGRWTSRPLDSSDISLVGKSKEYGTLDACILSEFASALLNGLVVGFIAHTAMAQNPDKYGPKEYGRIEWHGDSATLFAGNIRPLDLAALTLSTCLGIPVSSEDPHYSYHETSSNYQTTSAPSSILSDIFTYQNPPSWKSPSRWIPTACPQM